MWEDKTEYQRKAVQTQGERTNSAQQHPMSELNPGCWSYEAAALFVALLCQFKDLAWA